MNIGMQLRVLQAVPTFVHEHPPLGDGGCVEELAANVLQDQVPPTGPFSPLPPNFCSHAVIALLPLLVTFSAYLVQPRGSEATPVGV